MLRPWVERCVNGRRAWDAPPPATALLFAGWVFAQGPEVDARPENTLLHGFSRGSANLYALAAMDSRTPRPLFRHVVANAGGMAPDFPMNREIENGRFGATPFANTRWWLYCGAGDPNPDRDGCPAMRRSQKWLQDKGAKAELSEDVGGNHGGFHLRGQNVERALDWFVVGR
jgi:hypothetical protein